MKTVIVELSTQQPLLLLLPSPSLMVVVVVVVVHLCRDGVAKLPKQKLCPTQVLIDYNFSVF
jgi:hypothetical protein